MYSCCPEPLDLRIDSKKRVREDDSSQIYYKDGYGSYSTECASYPQFFPSGNCSLAPCTVKQSLDLQHLSIRQGSPISDEGFDEPSIPEETLPRFLNIQQYTDSDRDSHSCRSISSSPKDRRTIGGEVVPSHEKERRKPGRKPGQVSNVLHLWEFMRDLLHTADGRGIIEWISRQDGVFRVVNSSEVARLWGEKKKNKKQMTYEKLSRSLRYSRLEGYFADLPKDKNYPKKLCFKFGSKAKNWR
ncbi:unnamed protein product [Candidula unifasciata]|uniref:ETS domain-containing protein n=1 Tax=Candidula unifasciata TaxID=100452 RepID=A0A8S3YHQ7_9EUPU|nr:unnamed protein product [Candidula unifasciata]